MIRYIALLLAIIFVSTSAIADNRIVGHMTPLPEELLENPVALDCGAIIKEIRGSSMDYTKLNSLCTYAQDNFTKFIKAYGFKTNTDERFTWNISFLPERSCYRCLNDEAYRFNNRFVSGYVIGYTDRNSEYSFMSSVRDQEFNTTFLHEMFHAMSMHYGVYDNHKGDWNQKTATDEVLAQRFTEWLGYGK